MILTGPEIEALNLVSGATPARIRASTYDAAVDRIIQRGSEKDNTAYTLPPRGIVWVVSRPRPGPMGKAPPG